MAARPPPSRHPGRLQPTRLNHAVPAHLQVQCNTLGMLHQAMLALHLQLLHRCSKPLQAGNPGRVAVGGAIRSLLPGCTAQRAGTVPKLHDIQSLLHGKSLGAWGNLRRLAGQPEAGWKERDPPPPPPRHLAVRHAVLGCQGSKRAGRWPLRPAPRCGTCCCLARLRPMADYTRGRCTIPAAVAVSVPVVWVHSARILKKTGGSAGRAGNMHVAIWQQHHKKSRVLLPQQAPAAPKSPATHLSERAAMGGSARPFRKPKSRLQRRQQVPYSWTGG